jgi:hypothetical protein
VLSDRAVHASHANHATHACVLSRSLEQTCEVAANAAHFFRSSPFVISSLLQQIHRHAGGEAKSEIKNSITIPFFGVSLQHYISVVGCSVTRKSAYVIRECLKICNQVRCNATLRVSFRLNACESSFISWCCHHHSKKAYEVCCYAVSIHDPPIVIHCNRPISC